jgi:hypothetical protein
MSEFNWWLLIVGLVIGAGLVWLILADAGRREADVSETELPLEADWIASTLSAAGQPIDAATAEQVLRLHRTWLASLPPDERSAWADDEMIDAGGETSAGEPGATEVDAPNPSATGVDATRVDSPGSGADVVRARGDQPRDGITTSGTTPVWSATDPSPRRR